MSSLFTYWFLLEINLFEFIRVAGKSSKSELINVPETLLLNTSRYLFCQFSDFVKSFSDRTKREHNKIMFKMNYCAPNYPVLIQYWYSIRCFTIYLLLLLQVVYVTATFPYLVLIIFFFRGITLHGFDRGLEHLFVPEVILTRCSFTLLI